MTEAVAPRQLDQYRVHAATILQMQVRIKNVAIRGFESNDPTELDVFLLGDLEGGKFIISLSGGFNAFRNDEVGKILDHLDEIR